MQAGRQDQKHGHRRLWIALLGLCLGMAVTNGFARFAYGLMLPAMKAQMGWSYSQAGWLNTANAIGYIGGAVLTMALIRRTGAASLFAFGCVTTAGALLATGLYDALWWQTIWRMAAGLFGAMSFSTASALAAQLFPGDARRNALAIALLFGFGGGLGVILAGAAVPMWLAHMGSASWPLAWIGIGAVSIACLPLCLWSARFLRPPPPASGGAVNMSRAALPYRQMAGLMAGYGAFGLGYFVYLTFLSAWMTEQGAGAGAIAGTWVMLGLCLCLSPFVWRPILERFANGLPLALVLSGIALGTALPVFWPGLPALSAVVFGLSVFMAPGAVTAFLRHNLPMENWGAAMSLMTVIFALAQTAGPFGAGLIGDLAGSLDASLLAAAGVLLLGALAALTQRELAKDSPAP